MPENGLKQWPYQYRQNVGPTGASCFEHEECQLRHSAMWLTVTVTLKLQCKGNILRNILLR